jgi:hypothetical protein
MEIIKNEHTKEIIGVKEKPDSIDIIERKRRNWYGHVKRMQEKRLYLLTPWSRVLLEKLSSKFCS